MSQLTPQILLRAYAAGIFPMAESREDSKLYWIDPEMRGLLPLNKFHVPKSLRRTIRRSVFDVKCNTAFLEVMRGCAEATEERPNTWINAEIVKLYENLYAMGHAHSVECWKDGELVGGLYGVALGAAFFGESMFSRERDASKVALVHLVARLKAGGYLMLDTQFVTTHLRRFGVVEVSRGEYHRRLGEALKVQATFYPELPAGALDAVLQSSTQTS
ncbi:MAG TPA: leucyl/phenylalanyl-tRNA--protein transferase [Alphaproteobacteria bacterium]|nr:leucyl/phenylalanyl-tRNA--protein transferase [Alphaproteobacteria bacterium]